MCGIAGAFLRDPSLDVDMDALLTTLLDKIEHRGREATGFVALTDDGVGQWYKAAVPAKEFNIWRQRAPRETRVMLGHCRLATQGHQGFMENNHPVKRGPFFIIHNGHVSNDDELFKNAQRTRFGRVDSEAIAARLASLDDLSSLNVVMEELDGAAAVAAVDERDSSRLVVARGRSNPLYVYNGRKIVIFASTEWAVQQAHEKHVGRMGKNCFWQLKEGQMIEWRDGECEWSEFTPFERPVVYKKWEPYAKPHGEFAGYEGYLGVIDRPWQLTRQVPKAQEEKDEPKQLTVVSSSGTKKPEPSAENETGEVEICEVCNKELDESKGEVNFYRDPADSVTYFLCEQCFIEILEEEEKDRVESDIWDDVQRDWEERHPNISLADLEDMESEPIDDFENANRSIITRFMRGEFF